MEVFMDAVLMSVLGFLVFAAIGGWFIGLGWLFIKSINKIKYHAYKKTGTRKHKRKSLKR